MTQKERVLNYMAANGKINPLTSWTELGVYRLASRINDLKKEGWNIISNRKTVLNKYGEKVDFAEYSIKGEM